MLMVQNIRTQNKNMDEDQKSQIQPLNDEYLAQLEAKVLQIQQLAVNGARQQFDAAYQELGGSPDPEVRQWAWESFTKDRKFELDGNLKPLCNGRSVQEELQQFVEHGINRSVFFDAPIVNKETGDLEFAPGSDIPTISYEWLNDRFKCRGEVGVAIHKLIKEGKLRVVDKLADQTFDPATLPQHQKPSVLDSAPAQSKPKIPERVIHRRDLIDRTVTLKLHREYEKFGLTFNQAIQQNHIKVID